MNKQYITKTEVESIISDFFKTSIYTDTVTPIEYGFDFGNLPAIYIATKNVFTRLSRFNELVAAFAEHNIEVTDISVSPMPALDNRMKYGIIFSHNIQIID